MLKELIWWHGSFKYYIMYYIGTIVGALIVFWLARNQEEIARLSREKAQVYEAQRRGQGHGKKRKGKPQQKSFWQKIIVMFRPEVAKGGAFHPKMLGLNVAVFCVVFYGIYPLVASIRIGTSLVPKEHAGLMLFLVAGSGVFAFFLFLLFTKQIFAVALDFYALLTFSTIAFGKFGCILTNCCHGPVSDWGVYVDYLDKKLFLIQPFEAVSYIAALAATVWFMKKSKYYKPGRACSVNVWLYAIFRFFWEFLRYPVGIVIHEKEIFGLTKIQLILMFGVVIAAAWWFLVPLLSRALDALDERLNRRKTNKLG